MVPPACGRPASKCVARSGSISLARLSRYASSSICCGVTSMLRGSAT
ncbi:Uncharacterised protein [Bordetella pertussis]|nr:Uncharacterised protein [Bordetella pertussis]CFP66946.1 Uncharacterised protein [Bordetella pertussis]